MRRSIPLPCGHWAAYCHCGYGTLPSLAQPYYKISEHVWIWNKISQCAVVVILLSRHLLGLGKYLTLGYKKESAARATIIQQWRVSSTLSSTSTNTPHIFNASLLPAPLPSHHPLQIFRPCFVRSVILNNFVFQMAFLISRLLCLVLVLNLANCQLPKELADLAISDRSIYCNQRL